jgi:hypothetical protein
MPAVNNYYYRIYQYLGTWYKLQWNNVTKIATKNAVGSATAFVLPNNTIVDVYQKTANEVMIVRFNYPQITGDNLIYTIIPGVLLYQRYSPSSSPSFFDFSIYNTTTKEVTTYNYPITAVWYSYVLYPQVLYVDGLSSGDVVQQTCIGTTLRKTTYDGDFDISIDDTINSTICGYVAAVPEVIITEVKRIKIDHSCYDNPVYLVWKNTLGGWDQWLFQKTQTVNLDTKSTGEFEQAEYALSTSEGAISSLGSIAGTGMILGANNLTLNQFNAISELLYSPKVYQVQADLSKKIVLIKQGSFSHETKSEKHSIEFEISLQDINTVKS